MTESIVRLLPIAKAAVDADLVRMVEDLSERVISGAIKGAFVILLEQDDSVTTMRSKTVDRLKLAGALQWTLYRQIKHYDEE